VDWYSALSCAHLKALRYGTRSQGILQFYLHTIPAFAFSAYAKVTGVGDSANATCAC